MELKAVEKETSRSNARRSQPCRLQQLVCSCFVRLNVTSSSQHSYGPLCGYPGRKSPGPVVPWTRDFLSCISLGPWSIWSLLCERVDRAVGPMLSCLFGTQRWRLCVCVCFIELDQVTCVCERVAFHCTTQTPYSVHCTVVVPRRSIYYALELLAIASLLPAQ